MSGPSIGALEPAIVVLVILVLIVVRRTYLQIQGARFSAGRLFGYAAVYVLLFAALAVGTLYAAIVSWGPDAYVLAIPYGAFPVVAALVAAPYVRRIVRFEHREDGAWYYRLSWHIPVLYLVLFFARISAEFVVFGPSAFVVSFPPPAPPSVAGLVILIAVDLLFGISLGLLLGRGVGVYQAHREVLAREDRPPSAPPPPLPSE
ncbi:MAG TPA: hypothetical protein VEK13_01195 [Thermoplasmata archaeon]|nr:hypothetical protein [Thermoplasmata archaeon]